MTLSADPRQFMDWARPALPQAAAILADTYGVDGVLDLSRCLIAIPGARASRRLKELLVELAAERSLRLVPPRVVTLGSLPEHLYPPEHPPMEQAAALRIWVRAMRSLTPEQRAVVFPNEPVPEDLRGWLSLARLIQSLHQQVAGAGLRFADVAARCSDELLFDDGDRWNILTLVQEHFEEALARSGRTERHLARLDAVSAGAITCDAELWLIGVAEMPEVLRRTLRSLLNGDATRVHALVHAPATMQDAFDDVGCVRPELWGLARVPLADAQLSIVGHPSNQAAAAAHVLAKLGGRYAADEIVIGVPDPEVVPYVEQQLVTAGVPARYAGGTPIEASAPFLLLAAVAELLGSHSAEAFAGFVRHPDVGRWLESSVRGEYGLSGVDYLTALDEWCTERLPARIDRGAADDSRIVAALLRSVFSRDLLGSLGGRRSAGEWMSRLMDLLTEFYGSHPLNRDIPAERHLVAALKQIRNAAMALHRVPAELDETCDVATAIRVLLDDARGGSVPAEAGDAAVEMFGWLELHLDDAPVAILTGMNEPFVPEAINHDPFLPNAMRVVLGIEDNDRRYARDAYQLTAMLQSREHIHVIAGRRSVEGDPLRPSRLLLATDGTALAHRIRMYLGDEAATSDVSPSPTDAPLDVNVAMPGGERFDLPPERILSLDKVPETLNVTEFRDILADPWLYALKQAMGGRDAVDDAAREMDPLRFGSLAHRILEDFGTAPAARSADENEIADVLEHLLLEHAGRMFSGRMLPAARLQLEQLRLRLRSFARWQAEWVAAGWQIAAVECRTPEDGVPLDVDGMPIALIGRVDRIDYHAELQQWAIFDYKTSERAESAEDAHRTKKGKWINLQLPLYHFILPHLEAKDGVTIVDSSRPGQARVGYIHLCGEPREIGASIADWDSAALDGALDTARDAVRMLRQNHFEFAGLNGGFLTPDMKALLGHGRFVPLDDEDMAEEEVLA